ncbi:hypothetical protein ASF21_10850 [Arthrobacter sp. Leaf234]|nr:hypothetical protein ASF21_10850 [Arthrobacter sp. Leaf234]
MLGILTMVVGGTLIVRGCGGEGFDERDKCVVKLVASGEVAVGALFEIVRFGEDQLTGGGHADV